MMSIKSWVKIFKALGNEGRLKIMKLLLDGRERTVTEIKEAIDISLKATSKHLIILDNLGFVESSGKQSHVYYKIDLAAHPKIQEFLKKIF